MVDPDYHIRKWAEKQIARRFPNVHDEEIKAALVGSLVALTEVTAMLFQEVRGEDGKRKDRATSKR